jgi:hypothetical protein
MGWKLMEAIGREDLRWPGDGEEVRGDRETGKQTGTGQIGTRK